MEWFSVYVQVASYRPVQYKEDLAQPTEAIACVKENGDLEGIPGG